MYVLNKRNRDRTSYGALDIAFSFNEAFNVAERPVSLDTSIKWSVRSIS